MAQWVKDLGFSLLRLRLQLWHGFDPWAGNFDMLQFSQKKKKKKGINLYKEMSISQVNNMSNPYLNH